MINPNVYYSPREVVKLGQAGYFTIKSRMTLQKMIHDGKIEVSKYDAGSRTYYKIRGSELMRFMELGDPNNLPTYGGTMGVHRKRRDRRRLKPLVSGVRDKETAT